MWGVLRLGTLATSTLVIGAVLALFFRISVRWIGIIIGVRRWVAASAGARGQNEPANTNVPSASAAGVGLRWESL